MESCQDKLTQIKSEKDGELKALKLDLDKKHAELLDTVHLVELLRVEE